MKRLCIIRKYQRVYPPGESVRSDGGLLADRWASLWLFGAKRTREPNAEHRLTQICVTTYPHGTNQVSPGKERRCVFQPWQHVEVWVV